MGSNIILEAAIMLISGLLFGRLVKLVKLPNVTGYLIAGLLLGPAVFNIIPITMVDGFSVISDMALGFIAFSIGSEFNLTYYKKVGIAPIVIAITESFGAIILVTGVLLLLGFDLKLSILLGAIAAATAPAQTLMVINQYKAKGSLTSMLISVVAIDDAVALIGFGFASTFVSMMSEKSTNIALSLLMPLYEIVVSVLLGGIAAILMKLMLRWFQKPSNRICVIAGLLFGTYWLADLIHGSALLSCMALGAVLVNIYGEIGEITKVTDAFTPPLFVIFFVISGAGFEISALAGIGVIGVVYVLMRVLGKYLGAWFGGKVTKQEDKICKYLGPTLIPQAGVALGLIVAAGKLAPSFAPQIRVIILCSTFLYSLFGPICAKVSLQKAGEIVIPDKK